VKTLFPYMKVSQTQDSGSGFHAGRAQVSTPGKPGDGEKCTQTEVSHGRWIHFHATMFVFYGEPPMKYAGRMRMTRLPVAKVEGERLTFCWAAPGTCADGTSGADLGLVGFPYAP
jgi:hypothetical protein